MPRKSETLVFRMEDVRPRAEGAELVISWDGPHGLFELGRVGPDDVEGLALLLAHFRRHGQPPMDATVILKKEA